METRLVTTVVPKTATPNGRRRRKQIQVISPDYQAIKPSKDGSKRFALRETKKKRGKKQWKKGTILHFSSNSQIRSLKNR
jgi:hypothetical protein